MKKTRRKRPESRKESRKDVQVLRKVEVLLKEAKNVSDDDMKLAHKMVAIARKTAMKHKIRIPKHMQKRFCKHCYRYLKSGVNLRIRLAKKRVIYYCLSCKRHMRFPYKKSDVKKA